MRLALVLQYAFPHFTEIKTVLNPNLGKQAGFSAQGLFMGQQPLIVPELSYCLPDI